MGFGKRDRLVTSDPALESRMVPRWPWALTPTSERRYGFLCEGTEILKTILFEQRCA